MGAFVLRRALQSPAQSQPKPSRLAFLRVGEQTQSHFGDSSFTCLKCTCCRSVAKLCPILCNPMDYSMPGSLSSTIPQSLLKFMSIKSVILSKHLISATPFSFCLQSFPASGSFSVSALFELGGQSTGTSASASVLPMNIQGWFPLGLSGFFFLQSKGLSRVFANTTIQKHQNSSFSLLYGPTHIHTRLLGKP